MEIPEKRYEKQTESSLLLIARRDFLTKSLVLGTSIMGLNFAWQQKSVFAADIRSKLITPDQLHVTVLDMNGIIWHTIRYTSGSWVPNFGNVNNQERNGGSLSFTDVDCSGIGDRLHVTALDMAGIIWHTIRHADGSWEPNFGNVNKQEGNGGSLSFTDVDCAGMESGKLHIIALDMAGNIWHTIRYANGSWVANFGNVNNQERNGSGLHFTDLDCATIGEDLHVCGVYKGNIWHTIRYANGSWAPNFGNVNNQENNGNILHFRNVGCVSIGSDLHVAALALDGTIWHTIRHSDGSWVQNFGNVNNQEGNGGSLRFIDVDCANVGDMLHVTAVDQGRSVWHTIRHADGSWEPNFGNVNKQEHNGDMLHFNGIGAGGVV